MTMEIPEGFKFSGVSSGVKEGGKRDLGLLYSWEPAVTAGFFTQNRFKAHPVRIDIRRLRKGKKFRAILVNSGCANALNGEEGERGALILSGELAGVLDVEEEEILLASTGVIGTPLPRDKILSALPLLVKRLGKDNLPEFAEAIMTTDTHPKFLVKETSLPGRGKKRVRIGGVAKGAGMISPQLATMLVFLFTDACIEESALYEAMREAIEISFHNLLVEGDMSTNDTVIIMANGLARNPRIKQERESFLIFSNSLKEICQELAKSIARDGEGATRLIEIRVKGAWDRKDARRVARAIARSPLVKTAMYGGDPNWGRIISALGGTRVKFKPQRVELYLQGLKVFSNLKPEKIEEKELKKRLKEREIIIEVNLNHGPHEIVFWTCDLTEDYVRINAHYRT